jgi:hypothetical protein
LSSAIPNRKIILAIAGCLLSGLVQAAPQVYTDQATFVAALPGASSTVDFDSATADSLIPSGSALSGIAFSYALDGVQLKVSTTSGGYSTTSGSQFLGSDDADILQDGDTLTLSFSPLNAIGLYVISNDVLEDNDLGLTVGGTTASLLKTATQGGPLGDGSVVYFLGIIDSTTPFATASLNTAGNTAFLFNLDDIITVESPDDDSDGILDVADTCILVANPVQRDTDSDGYGNMCDPDFNGNGIVDPSDFSLLKSRFGQPGFPDQDLNGNGIVDPSDFSLLKTMFGQPPGPSCCPVP